MNKKGLSDASSVAVMPGRNVTNGYSGMRLLTNIDNNVSSGSRATGSSPAGDRQGHVGGAYSLYEVGMVCDDSCWPHSDSLCLSSDIDGECPSPAVGQLVSVGTRNVSGLILGDLCAEADTSPEFVAFKRSSPEFAAFKRSTRLFSLASSWAVFLEKGVSTGRLL